MSAYGHAKITVTFEVSLQQPWSDAETMGHLAKVIPRDAREALVRLARDPKVLAKRAFRMRGRDRVTALSVYSLETRFFGEPIPLVFGAVESVATIAGYVDDDGEAMWRKRDGTLVTGCSGDHLRCHDARLSKWYMGQVGWVLDEVVTLPKPVPCRGAQGLWTLPADVESAVLAQLGGEHG